MHHFGLAGGVIFTRLKDESSSSEDDSGSAKQNPVSNQPEVLHSSGGHCYRKTLRLSPEQLVSISIFNKANQ